MSESSPFTFIGMDVSRDKIAIAMLRPGEQVPIELTIAATDEAVRKQVRRWGDPAAVRACCDRGARSRRQRGGRPGPPPLARGPEGGSPA